MVKEVGEDRRERGEMNCGNLGEGCGRRNFPGDTIILLSNIDQIFETKRSAKESDHD